MKRRLVIYSLGTALIAINAVYAQSSSPSSSDITQKISAEELNRRMIERCGVDAVIWGMPAGEEQI